MVRLCAFFVPKSTTWIAVKFGIIEGPSLEVVICPYYSSVIPTIHDTNDRF